MVNELVEKFNSMRLTVNRKKGHTAKYFEIKEWIDELDKISNGLTWTQYNNALERYKKMVFRDYKTTTKKDMDAMVKYIKIKTKGELERGLRARGY